MRFIAQPPLDIKSVQLKTSYLASLVQVFPSKIYTNQRIFIKIMRDNTCGTINTVLGI